MSQQDVFVARTQLRRLQVSQARPSGNSCSRARPAPPLATTTPTPCLLTLRVSSMEQQSLRFLVSSNWGLPAGVREGYSQSTAQLTGGSKASRASRCPTLAVGGVLQLGARGLRNAAPRLLTDHRRKKRGKKKWEWREGECRMIKDSEKRERAHFSSIIFKMAPLRWFFFSSSTNCSTLSLSLVTCSNSLGKLSKL